MIFQSRVFLCVMLISATYADRKNSVEKYFNVCQRSDPKLDVCIRESFEALRPRLAEGINEIGIPPLEPLHIQEIKLEEDTGAIALYSHYKNITIHGLSKCEIRDIRIDLNKHFLELETHFPYLELKADYKISGKIMMMPLQGEGPCSGNFTNVNVTSSIRTGKTMKNDREHLTAEEIKVDFDIGNTSVNLVNLFNGDEDLGLAMNKFLNENWETIMVEIKPTLEDKMAHLLKMIAAKLFHTFSYDDLLPK